ncbi:MAG: VWA domain-containing protein [Pyrinomonadaceae bacterium]
MPIRRSLILLSILLTSSFVCIAQDDNPVRVDSSIVRLNVGVVDDRGHPIMTLGQSSFTIYEDGVKQDISHFVAAPAPFSVVMMLDMSGSTKSFRQNIQMAASRFLDALAPDDRLAVVEFYSKVNLLNDFTTDRRTAFHSISVANGSGETDFYKGLLFALGKLSGEKNRRKAIVVLTDGIDTAAQDADRKLLANLKDEEIPSAIKPEMNEVLRRILDRSDAQGVTIYPLALPTGDPARLADPTPRQVAMYTAARARLKLVAERSGGTLNSIKRLEDMGTLYALVAADLRTLYTIEYQPANDKKDGKWRAIKVVVDQAGLIPRSRQGYFAK